MQRLAIALCSGLGVGFIPFASGTFGSLWGILIFFLWRNWTPQTFALALALLFFLSVFLVFQAEKKLASKDSSVIVIDEVVGYLVAVWGFSFGFWSAGLAFGLFRLFDIWKPFPIRAIDRRCKNAWGVVLDDVLAGVAANLSLRLLWWLGSRWL